MILGVDVDGFFQDILKVLFLCPDGVEMAEKGWIDYQCMSLSSDGGGDLLSFNRISHVFSRS